MNNENLHKTIKCGKLDWNGTGRRTNEAELELSLERRDGHWRFSCCGAVWDRRHSDWIAGGQCLDEMFRHEEMKPWSEIHALWQKHHCNDLHAGTPKQEKAVEAWSRRREKQGKRYDYGEACGMLKRKGLYEDKDYLYDGKPYKYGHAWLKEDIPEADLEKIRKWMA